MRKSRRPKAKPRVAICIRIETGLEARRRRLEELLDLTAPELLERGVTLIEAQIALINETRRVTSAGFCLGVAKDAGRRLGNVACRGFEALYLLHSLDDHHHRGRVMHIGNSESTGKRTRTECAKSWRDVLPVHPAAELCPMMSGPELQTVGQDIKKNGLHIAVAVFKEEKHFPPRLLDGRNRLAAMEAVNIAIRADSAGTATDPQVQLWYRRTDKDMWLPIETTVLRGDRGVNPFEYVDSANILRRHLTTEQKRELIAKLLAATPDKSNRQIAETIKASHTTVGAVRAEMEGRGQIGHVETRTDTKGRKQPVKKPKLKEADLGGKPAESVGKTRTKQRAVRPPEELPTAEECDEEAQETIYDQACSLLEMMADATRQRFFAHIKKQYPASDAAVLDKVEERAP